MTNHLQPRHSLRNHLQPRSGDVQLKTKYSHSTRKATKYGVQEQPQRLYCDADVERTLKISCRHLSWTLGYLMRKKNVQSSVVLVVSVPAKNRSMIDWNIMSSKQTVQSQIIIGRLEHHVQSNYSYYHVSSNESITFTCVSTVVASRLTRLDVQVNEIANILFVVRLTMLFDATSRE